MTTTAAQSFEKVFAHQSELPNFVIEPESGIPTSIAGTVDSLTFHQSKLGSIPHALELRRCQFEGTLVEDALFKATHFFDSTFQSIAMRDTLWENALFSDHVFTQAVFDKVRFTRCQATNTILDDVQATQSEFLDCDFKSLSLKSSVWQHTNIRQSRFTDATFYAASFTNCDFNDLVLMESVQEQTNIEQSNLRHIQAIGGRWKEFICRNSTLEHATLSGIKLHKGKFIECRFDSALWSENEWQHVVFVNCQFQKLSLKQVKLSQCRFENCTFDDAVFEDSDWRNVTFEQCDLSGLSARNSMFFECHFNDCKFSGESRATFEQCTFRGGKAGDEDSEKPSNLASAELKECTVRLTPALPKRSDLH